MRQWRPLWLFGENRGHTIDNNSWHAYRRVCRQSTRLPVRARFVLNPTRAHRAVVGQLPLRLRRGIVWRGSPRHVRLFEQADRFFIALSFGDVEPPQIAGGSPRRVPLVHLQHGTIGIKQVGYRGDYYRNTIDAFCIYADQERTLLQQHNGFRPDQLFRLSCPPRYGALLSTQRRHPTQEGHVLWFLTWRDYLDAASGKAAATPAATAKFVDSVVSTLSDPQVAAQLRSGEMELSVCFHQFFPREVVDAIAARIADHPELVDVRDRIRLLHAADTDLMRLMSQAQMLVTDYSSLGYDMTFLGKPVGMYMFDLADYLSHRDTYVDLREVFTEHVAHAPHEFTSMVRAARGTVHSYYADRVRTPTSGAERDWIIAGAHIDELLVEMLRRDLDQPPLTAALRTDRHDTSELPQGAAGLPEDAVA